MSCQHCIKERYSYVLYVPSICFMNHYQRRRKTIYTQVCRLSEMQPSMIYPFTIRSRIYAWVCCSWVSWASRAAFSSLDNVSRILWNPSKTPAWFDSLYTSQKEVKHANRVGDSRPGVDLTGTMSVGDLLDKLSDGLFSALEELSDLGFRLKVLGNELLHELLSLGICQCRASH